MSTKKNALYLLVTTVLVFSFLLSTNATNTNEDVLSQKEATNLNEICDNFITSNYNNPTTLKTISERLLDKRFERNAKFNAFGNYALAEASYYSQNYKDALKSYNVSLTGFIDIKDTLRIATTYNAIGVVNYIIGDNDRACEAYLNAYSFYSPLNNQLGMAGMYHNIALIFWRSNNYEKGDDYGIKSIEIYKQIGEQNYLAKMYNNYAASLMKRKDYTDGLFYYSKALIVYHKIEDKASAAEVEFNIGTLYDNTNTIDSARYYYTKSHSFFLQSNDTSNLAISYQKIAKLNLLDKEYNSAILNLIESEKLNKKNNNTELNMQLNLYFAESYEGLGDYKEALRRQRVYQAYSDTIKNGEIQAKITEMESKFQVEQTKKEMNILKRESSLQNFILVFVVIIFLLVVVSLYFYWKNLKNEEEKRSLMLEHKVLRTQMDPHFIFNSLSALQCYIMDDKPDEAIKFLTDFSALLRMVLQYSRNELIPVAKEKKILEYYLALQNKRFDDKIRFEINIDDKLVAINALIPPMLAQPFIENSLVHAGFEQIENAAILINFIKVGHFIKLTIEDNGIGLEAALSKARANPNHKSMAISITNERLSLLNIHQKDKVNLSIRDLVHEGLRGTKVEFMIPIPNKPISN